MYSYLQLDREVEIEVGGRTREGVATTVLLLISWRRQDTSRRRLQTSRAVEALLLCLVLILSIGVFCSRIEDLGLGYC